MGSQLKWDVTHPASLIITYFGVHQEMVDFGFRQGPSEFSTTGIARYVED
jgi:hypothetical protein